MTALPWPERADWSDFANCIGTDAEAFFPEKGGSTREAKRVCAGCDVRAECLEDALANDERFGVRGGMSERERRKLRQQRTEQAVAEVIALPEPTTGRAAA